ncbi:MAG: HEXXH motif-containing putative peptide modification protein [Nocardioides sp.]
MTSSIRFAGVAALDVDPVDCFAVYEGLAAKIRRSYEGLSDILNKVDGAPGDRLGAVLGSAPQVLTTAAGYCWLNATYAAIAGNDPAALQILLREFSRFEAAAAVSSRGEFDGAFPFHDPVSLPGTGLVVRATGGALAVRAGELEAASWAMPTAGSLMVDGHDPVLRSPRSMSQFDLAEPSPEVAGAGAEELLAARELADQIAPGLFDRYVTDVVPLVAEPGIAHAGTDDAAPWAVYLSFGREPTDLIAALAHEESHALVQTLAKLVPELLPDSQLDMPVPWKPGVRRSLSGVLHGLIAFGRAASVRSRGARLGYDSPANAEALEREHGWVAGVTSALLEGTLGPLSEELGVWLQDNLASIDSPVPSAARGIDVLARDGGGPDFGWRLLSGESVGRAAGEIYPQVARLRWTRGVPGYPDQDRGEMDGPGHSLLTEEIPALIEREWGTRTELAGVKVHRLRTGDHIRPHTDALHDNLTHRLVLGLTPYDLRSGELRLLVGNQQPVMSTQPQFGQALLFQLADPSYHEVTENRSMHPRLTVIASYRLQQ